MWNIPESAPTTDSSPTEKAFYDKKVLILTWYLDIWLPFVVGVDWFGPMIRPYKLMTDMVEILGKQKVLVTVTSEAFGLLQYENSREVWINNFKYKLLHGEKKTPPQYNAKKAEMSIYKAKWSNANSGQCSGWDRAAFGVFEERKNQIKAFRAEEAKNDYKKMKYGQGLIKIANKIEVDAADPAKRAAKRARTDAGEGVSSDVDEEVDMEFEEE